MDEFKKSEDLEIYEMDYNINNKSQIEEACKMRQPFFFEFAKVDPKLFQRMSFEEISREENNDFLQIFDSNDFYNNNNNNKEESLQSFPLRFESAIHFMNSDKKKMYLTEKNGKGFMVETGLSLFLRNQMDRYFKPPFGNVNSEYDICFGSKGSSTPWRYHMHSRHFIAVTSGKLKVKMTPWKSSKNFQPYMDIENYDFLSKTNFSDKQESVGKCIDFTVNQGYILCIPAYWWYTKQFVTNDTFSFSATYDTLFNTIAHVDKILQYYWYHNFIIQKNVVFTKKDKKKEEITTADDVLDLDDADEVVVEEVERRTVVSASSFGRQEEGLFGDTSTFGRQEEEEDREDREDREYQEEQDVFHEIFI